jgi:TPR repeat protein
MKGKVRFKSNMKSRQTKKTFFLRCYALAAVVLVLCAGAINVFAADSKIDDPMLQRLYELHLKLAQQGNLESITRLGMMYERGEGVDKSREKAIELYRTAANKGYKPAIKLLANITSKNPDEELTKALDELRVPTLKKQIADDKEKIRKQKKLEEKLRREQAEAERARRELERLRQSKQEEEEKQRKMLEEIQKVKQVQEQLAREREKAEAARREMEQLRKKQEEELKRQQAQREALERQRELAQQGQSEQSPAEEKTQDKEDKPDKTFSSDPCKTPAAKFMSTCN